MGRVAARSSGAALPMFTLTWWLSLLVTLAVVVSPPFASLRRAFDRIARRRRLAVVLVGALAFAHCALLSAVRLPLPVYADEFSYLFMAETFASGRLTNPPPPLEELFWTPEVIVDPTFQSKYPPAQGVFLALGQLLGGQPIVGVWLSMALACAAVCWMMQAYVPPRWALVGGLLLATHKALASYWGGTYFGGAVAMLGGALLFGALPRLLESPRVRHGLLLGAGLVLLANSRPFEGLVASLPAAVVLAAWWVRQRGWSSPRLTRRFLVPVASVLLLGAVGTGVYHRAVTGSPWRMPYFVYLSSHEEIRNVAMPGTEGWRAPDQRSPLLSKHLDFFAMGGDPHLLAPLLFLPVAAVKSRWAAAALGTTALTYLAVWTTLLASTHYAAPVTPLVFLLWVQSFRHFRVALSRIRGLFPLFLAVFLVGWGGQLLDSPGFHGGRFPRDHEFYSAIRRAELEAPLLDDDDRHMVVSPWDGRHLRHYAWANTAPDPDAAEVIWVHQGLGLVERFPDRRFWLLDDSRPDLRLVEIPAHSLQWVLRGGRGREADDRIETSVSGARVLLENGGSEAVLACWHPALERGESYEISFRARASRPGPFGIEIGHGLVRRLPESDLRWEREVGSEWSDFEIRFEADVDLEHAGIMFTLPRRLTTFEISLPETGTAGEDP